MNEGLISLITALISAGGIGYLIIEKVFSKRKDNAEAHSVEVENAHSVASLYKSIDEIVQSKTEKLEAKQDRMEKKIDLMSDEIESLKSLRCVRSDCKERIKFDRNNII